jgi:hypothetical protein
MLKYLEGEGGNINNWNKNRTQLNSSVVKSRPTFSTNQILVNQLSWREPSPYNLPLIPCFYVSRFFE